MKQKFLVSAILGMAVVLLGSSTTQAQSYFYGYYYPDSGRFHTNDVADNGYDSYEPSNAELYSPTNTTLYVTPGTIANNGRP